MYSSLSIHSALGTSLYLTNNIFHLNTFSATSLARFASAAAASTAAA
jgi:hypothetical protein